MITYLASRLDCIGFTAATGMVTRGWTSGWNLTLWRLPRAGMLETQYICYIMLSEIFGYFSWMRDWCGGWISILHIGLKGTELVVPCSSLWPQPSQSVSTLGYRSNRWSAIVDRHRMRGTCNMMLQMTMFRVYETRSKEETNWLESSRHFMT